MYGGQHSANGQCRNPKMIHSFHGSYYSTGCPFLVTTDHKSCCCVRTLLYFTQQVCKFFFISYVVKIFLGVCNVKKKKQLCFQLMLCAEGEARSACGSLSRWRGCAHCACTESRIALVLDHSQCSGILPQGILCLGSNSIAICSGFCLILYNVSSDFLFVFLYFGLVWWGVCLGALSPRSSWLRGHLSTVSLWMTALLWIVSGSLSSRW